MQDLSVNMNVAKARTMLGMVSGDTYVDRNILLEDDGFCTMLTQCAHNDTIESGVAKLTQYVNNNF
jgi:hypothetical protein